jgi:hypothetical protein
MDSIANLVCLFQVPENYLRAIFGSHLASRFVYQYGNQPSQFSFFDLYVSLLFFLFDLNENSRTNKYNSMTRRIAQIQSS